MCPWSWSRCSHAALRIHVRVLTDHNQGHGVPIASHAIGRHYVSAVLVAFLEPLLVGLPMEVRTGDTGQYYEADQE